jgi:hypothetical protein
MYENDNYYNAQNQALAGQQASMGGMQNMQYGAATSCAILQGSSQGYQEYTKQVLQKEKGKLSMLKEFKSYVAEHKDLIFSVILLALADKVFLDGALQAKLASLIYRIVEGMEKKVAPTLNTEAK